MLILSGAAAFLTFTVLVTKFMTAKRKSILAGMSFSAFVMLIMERYAYIFSGDESEFGYTMVRISNGCVFFLLILTLHFVTQYLKDLLCSEGKLKTVPIGLRLCDVIFYAGTILLAVSQFTGLYYFFDMSNVYQRSPGIIVSYIPPMMIVILQELTVIKHRKRLSNGVFIMLLLSIALPSIASIVQLLAYGISWTCMFSVLSVIIYYIFMLIDINQKAEKAKAREIEFYKEARRIEAAMFEQTAEALVNAIDAKDEYTRGHSVRVATYSRQIAEQFGLSSSDCEEIYFAALLHDVGKIGVPSRIIRKVGRLTDEEYEQIKLHTVIGAQILSGIKQSPYLGIGAMYHHERFDGKGYPQGLSDDDIPQIARIIAVADTYDAMSSNRSYRSALPMTRIIEELQNGIGKQFDPRFAKIMLNIIDNENKPAV